MVQSENLYKDSSGNSKLGAYLNRKPNGRYYAQIKFYRGYDKTKLFYEEEEAKAWIDANYDDVKNGVYYDIISGRKISLPFR